MVRAPALIATSIARTRNSGSERVASSADHSTSGTRLRASDTDAWIASSTSSGVLFSLTRIWSGDVAMKVWMRGFTACFTAAAARSISAVAARARLATRSEEHTSELQSLMRISYAVFCLKKNKIQATQQQLE